MLNIVKGRPLADPILPFFQLCDEDGNLSQELFANGVADVYGSQHVLLYGPDGSVLIDSQNRIAVKIDRRNLAIVEFTIANAANLSGQINLNGASMGILFMPSAWTAANLTFQIGQWENGTYYNLYDENGSEVVVTAAAARAIPIPPELIGAQWIKVRSGTSGTPVNQGAQRTFYLILKG